MFGGGSIGLGGGMRNPSLFLTAPLLVSSTRNDDAPFAQRVFIVVGSDGDADASDRSQERHSLGCPADACVGRTARG